MREVKNFSCVTLLFLLLSVTAYAQRTSVRTNLLYWATTTPNVSFEWKVGNRYTFSTTIGYNALNFPTRTNDLGEEFYPKVHHWLVMPEVKYWLCKAFQRHYFGIHALYGDYNIGGLEFPACFSENRYEGLAAGVGVSYGYQWALGNRWGIEASIGAGYVYLRYDKYECIDCGQKKGAYRRHCFAPTKATLSIIYFIR